MYDIIYKVYIHVYDLKSIFLYSYLCVCVCVSVCLFLPGILEDRKRSGGIAWTGVELVVVIEIRERVFWGWRR